MSEQPLFICDPITCQIFAPTTEAVGLFDSNHAHLGCIPCRNYNSANGFV
jgi:hypothetical protein